MEWYGLMLGAAGGLFGTLIMSAIEGVAWRKWGLLGVFEWHENQMLMVRFLNLEHDARLRYLGISGLHLINGVLGGIGFYFVIAFIDNWAILLPPLPLLGTIYSFFLWVVTLIPIHKPITGFHPWDHPLGHGPALVSLAGHFAYGLVLSLLFLVFT
jgi:hypothetical protein